MMTAPETPKHSCGKPMPRTDYETGETACENCGAVLGMMQEAPHTADNRSIAPYRANATEIHGGCASLKRAVKISKKPDVTGINVSLTVKACCDKLGLPRSMEQRSIALFAKSRHMLKGRTAKNISAASVYMACREHSVTRTLKEVCDTMDAHYKRTRRVYMAICAVTEQKLPIMNPVGLVTRIASDLGLPEKFTRQALDMLERMNATGLAEGKSPMSLSACAIHMTAGSNPTKIMMKDICRAADITEAGLRNNAKMFREKLDGRRPAGRRARQTAVGSTLNLPKKKLCKMYMDDKMNIKEIGYALDCNPALVARKMAKYGIKKRYGGQGATVAVEIQKNELERLYVTERRTLADIAREHGCGVYSVRRLLAKHDIAVPRTRKRA